MNAEEATKKVAEQKRRTQRIRKRVSYSLFNELYEFLMEKPGTEAILRRMHEVLDSRHIFGSRRNAVFAFESLEQVLKDNEEVLYV